MTDGIFAAPRDASKPRLRWPDAAKGAGIILVVAGHILGGLIDSKLSLGRWPLREALVLLYTFHMPLFFILSGLFVSQRLVSDRNRFVKEVATKIYYPYLLWSFIQYTVIFFMGKWTNTPPGDYVTSVLSIPYTPMAQFWFLLALAGMHLGAALLLHRIGAVAFVLLALVIRSVGSIFDPVWILSLSFNFFFFYALGVLLGSKGVEDVLRPRSMGRAVIGTVAAVGILIMTVQVMIAKTPASTFYQDNPHLTAAAFAQIAWQSMGTGAALAMSAVVIVWAINARGPVKAALVYLGRLSLPIYILHVLFIAGLRIVAVKIFGMTDIALLIPVLLVIGILGPITARAVLDRLHLARALGLA